MQQNSNKLKSIINGFSFGFESELCAKEAQFGQIIDLESKGGGLILGKMTPKDIKCYKCSKPREHFCHFIFEQKKTEQN